VFTRHDFLDAFRRHLSAGPASRPKGRRFWTEREVRKALTPGAKDLKIPGDVIISPLAQEWLALEGVKIVVSSI
jgi:hypothetical protein